MSISVPSSLKRIAFAAALSAVASSSCAAQQVFSVDRPYQADINVYVTDRESRADLVVYRVKSPSQATGNEGLWYFTDYKGRADKAIYFVDRESQADLVIYFTDYRSRAGWKSKKKMALMY